MTDELIHQTATTLASRISRRDVSAREVVAAHLDRIDEVNGEVNAIVSMRTREDIMADAVAADHGDITGPLHGLPVAVKDLQDVAGLPTRAGSLTTSDRPARTDGLIASRLRRAGAIIVGKTNTPEFGTGCHTFNEVFGVTRNPWNLDRSAGGSSGGAAAALASRMLPIADGSDLGGSLRNPAGFCGVVGLRPSIGRVPDPLDAGPHLTRLPIHGPMGRTVADVALILRAIAGKHVLDPQSLTDDPAVFTRALPERSTARIAWGGDLGVFTAEPEVLGICRAGAAHINSMGGSLVDAQPDLRDAMEAFRILRGVQYRSLGAGLSREDRSLVKSTVLENIEYGESLTVDDLRRAAQLRAQLHIEMTRFFSEFDVLALPTAQVAPFPADQEFPTEIAGTVMTDYLHWMTACCVITPTTCPAISIPAGFTAAGLPVGLQLVAPVGKDRMLLEVAHAIEAMNPLHLQRPQLLHLG